MGKLKEAVSSLKKRSTAIGAVGAASMLAAAVLVVQSSPRSELDVQLSDGAVWLASTAVGGVSLLDGGSGTIAASLGVADPGDVFTVEQFGSDAVIVNQTDGTVARLDGSSWEIPTGRVQFGVPGQPMHVVTGQDTGWLMTPGQATTVELEALALRTPVPVAAPFADGIITDDGALLYSSSDPDLPVQRFAAVGGQSTTVEGLDGPTALIDLGDAVAAVDLDDRAVWLDGVGTVCEQLEFPEGAELSAGGGDGQLIVVSDQGGAFVWDPTASGCPGAANFINLGPADYGQPALTDGWAVVPEISSGSVLVIDLESMSITDRQPLEGVDAGTEVSLIAEDGSIWYNDPASAQAGLIRRDGTIVPIAKYEEGTTGFTSAPVDDAPDGSDDMSLAGAQEAPEEEEEVPEAESVAGPELTTTTLAGTGDEPEPETQAATTSTTQATNPDPDTSDTTETTDPDPDPDPDTSDTTDGGNGEPDPGTDPGGTTTSTTEQPEPEVQPFEISMGATALSVIAGETVTFEVIVQHGEANNFGSPQFLTPGPILQPAETIRFFTVLFPEVGTFNISWTVCSRDDDTDCDTAITQTTVVEDPDAIPLVAGIDGPTTVLVGETATFTDISQGDPDAQSWSTERGATNGAGTGTTFDTSWTFPGPKTVNLTVERDGVIRSASFAVDVVAAPEPAPFGVICTPTSLDVGGEANCQLDGDEADFSDLAFSTSADGAAGFTSSTPTPRRLTLSSTQERSVTVTLSATDDGTGESVSDTATVTFNAPLCAAVVPTVSASGPSTLEVGSAGSFTGSPDTGCGNVGRSWSATGGGSVSNPNAASTNITWDTPGTYTVTYNFSDGGGSASDSVQVTVEEPVAGPTAPSVSITGSANLETDETGNFNVNNSGGPVDTYSWTTNGGGGSGSGESFSPSWTSAGTFTVTLNVSGPGGSDTATRSVTVSDPPPQASPFGMTCDRSTATTEQMINCDLTTGDPADFSNPQWSTTAAGGWQMSDWSYDAQGDTPGTSVTVTLSATDNATGQTVSNTVTIDITAPVVQPATMTMSCDVTTTDTDDIFSCNLTSGNSGEFSNPTWSAPGAQTWLMSPWSYDVQRTTAGTVTVTLSATDIATGQTVSASHTVTVNDAAPPPPTPENLTISCPGAAAIGERFNCSISSGNAGSFSGLTWTVSPAGSHQRWGGGGSLDVTGTVAGTLSIQLTGTDNGTGQVVSTSASVSIS